MFTYLTTGVFGASDEQAADYKAKCHKQFPHACLFKDSVIANYDNIGVYNYDDQTSVDQKTESK